MRLFYFTSSGLTSLVIRTPFYLRNPGRGTYQIHRNALPVFHNAPQ